jgi:deazaflavin-dependent oxidoreductase (nitroreductase family)
MRPPPSSSPLWKVFEALTRVNVVAYRLTGGKVGGRLGKAPILLLHHRGARSGAERVSPLIYLPDGEDAVIVASKGGTDRHPAWFHNLRANPDTVVEIGRERRRVRARVAEPAERERLWPLVVGIYRSYESYQTYTERTIPLVILEPSPGAAA